jgi:hypothetical protein
MKIVAVSIDTIRKARARISACETCDPTADMRFDSVLSTLAYLPSGARFVMSEPATCPACGANVFEHTLVERLAEVRNTRWRSQGSVY